MGFQEQSHTIDGRSPRKSEALYPTSLCASRSKRQAFVKRDSQSGITAGQTACKPGILSSPEAHKRMAIPLGTPVASASRDRTRRRSETPLPVARHAATYLVLLPGVWPCRYPLHRSQRVGSYPTVSPLPARQPGRRSVLCVHFPWVAPAYVIPDKPMFCRGARTSRRTLPIQRSHPAV